MPIFRKFLAADNTLILMGYLSLTAADYAMVATACSPLKLGNAGPLPRPHLYT